jgi:hypothetical protein
MISHVARPVLQHVAPLLAQGLSNVLNEILATVPTSFNAPVPPPGAPLHHQAQPLEIAVAKHSVYTEGTGAGYGVNVGFNLGFNSRPSRCVPAVSASPRESHLFTPPFENGFVQQANGSLVRYQAGFSIAQELLQQATEALFRGGWLCMNIDAQWLKANTKNIPVALNAALLATLDSRITTWAPSQAPLLLNIRPLITPVLELVHNGYGSSLHVNVPSLEIGIAVWVDDVPMQLSTFVADLVVDIEIVQDGSENLQLALRNLELANIAQTYNELFPNKDLSAGIRAVADITLAQVKNLTIPLSYDLASLVPGLSSAVVGVTHASAAGKTEPFMQMYLDLR